MYAMVSLEAKGYWNPELGDHSQVTECQFGSYLTPYPSIHNALFALPKNEQHTSTIEGRMNVERKAGR